VAKPAAPVGPSFRIESNQARDRWLKALFYADFGVGKTYLCGTAVEVPSMQDVLMINAESGDLTLWDPNNKIPFHLIDIVRVTDYKQLGRVYDFLKLHCTYRDAGPEAEPKLIELQKRFFADNVPDPERIRRYRTGMVDSLTEVEQYCMNSLLGIDATTRMDEETATAEWAQYRQQHQMVQRMIRNFRDLPMHMLFTCHRTYVQDEAKRMLFSPGMTGKLSSQVQGFMDVVGYLQVGTSAEPDKLPPRRLYVQPGKQYAAKCRFSAFKKPYFEDPTMKSILQQVGLI
jgi:hypothetical protein